MIVHKSWLAIKGRGISQTEWFREGWFLFGFIPLYIRDNSGRGTA